MDPVSHEAIISVPNRPAPGAKIKQLSFIFHVPCFPYGMWGVCFHGNQTITAVLLHASPMVCGECVSIVTKQLQLSYSMLPLWYAGSMFP